MRKWNKLLAMLLAMVMVFGLTATAFAETEGDTTEPETPTEAAEPAEGEDAAAPAEGEDAAEPAEGEETAEPVEGEEEEAGEPAPIAEVYADVETWAQADVAAVVEMGLIDMTEETGFQPTVAMNRGDLVLALYRLAGNPEVAEDAENPFTDIDDLSDEAKAAVAWAFGLKIVNGETETTFNPNGAIERQGIAKVLFVFAGEKAAEVEEDQLAAFSDKDDVAEWAVPYLNWLVSTKLMNGSDGKLLPMESIDRQSVACILNRYINNILNAEAAEPTEPAEGETDAAEPTEGEEATEPAEGAEGDSPAEPEPSEVEVPENETEGDEPTAPVEDKTEE